MDMSGEQRIEAPREVVWAALNDPEILKKCIPGCQALEKQSHTEMTALAVIKVGPVSAKFHGAVTLSDLDPPNGYRITGEGQGGMAGFAKGWAEVRLTAQGEATILNYSVSAQIGGKLSQLGGRLIDATARKMSDAFFKRFAEEIALSQSPETGQAGAEPDDAERPSAGHSDRTKSGTAAEVRTGPTSVPPAIFPPTLPRWSVWLNSALLLSMTVMMVWLVIAGSALGPSSMSSAPISPEFALSVQFLLVLAVGYLLGRQHTEAYANALDRQILHTMLSNRQGPQQ